MVNFLFHSSDTRIQGEYSTNECQSDLKYPSFLTNLFNQKGPDQHAETNGVFRDKRQVPEWS